MLSRAAKLGICVALSVAGSVGMATAQSVNSAGEAQTVRIIIANPSFAFSDVFVARHTGGFEKVGLKVEWGPFVPGTGPSTNVVLTGDADVSFTAMSGPIAAVSQGRDVKVAAINTTGQPTLVTLTNAAVEKLAAEGVTQESSIEDRLKALKGLRIGSGSAGGSIQVILRDAISSVGMNPDSDVLLQSIGDPASMLAAMKTGQIDGFAFSPPFALQPTFEGWGKIWISGPSGEIESWNRGYYTVGVTSGAFAAHKPEVIEKVVAALNAAQEIIRNDPDKAAKAMAAEFPALPHEMLVLALSTVGPVFSGATVEADKVAESIEQFARQADRQVEVTPGQLIIGN